MMQQVFPAKARVYTQLYQHEIDQYVDQLSLNRPASGSTLCQSKSIAKSGFLDVSSPLSPFGFPLSQSSGKF